MNGTRILMETDTATTVNELCGDISQRVGVADRSGFSIYVTLGHRVSFNLTLSLLAATFVPGLGLVWSLFCDVDLSFAIFLANGRKTVE